MDEPAQTLRKGVTAIIYDDMGEKYFLILHRNTSWKGWEFVKGSLVDGESTERAAAREIFEETGIRRFSIKKKLDCIKEYLNSKSEHCVHDVFLVEASMNVPVHTDPEEHDTYQWSKKDIVMQRLTHDADKTIFQEALNALGMKNV